MPVFDICLFRLDRDHGGADVLYLTVDWPFLPREVEGLDVAEDLDPVTVESVGYDLDGYPMVHVGRVVLDDIQEAQLRKAGCEWRQYLPSSEQTQRWSPPSHGTTM